MVGYLGDVGPRPVPARHAGRHRRSAHGRAARAGSARWNHQDHRGRAGRDRRLPALASVPRRDFWRQRPELIRFIQQWSGYCLTGDIREHALVFGFGNGKNGKSVWLNTITGIMRDYAVTAPMETFTASKFDRHPTELAMLRGARLVTASETEKDRLWAESRIKQITGGDRISARFMRQDFFEFTPQLQADHHRQPQAAAAKRG